eukprot:Gb_00701 [translate_table: standard]
MPIGFAEFLPVGILITTVSDELIKTAVAAQDIHSEKSFNVLAKYLLSIQTLLHKLNAREIDGNSCLVRGLTSLKEEVAKAESLINKYKDSSRISNILHCRRICEKIQKSIRDIGNTLSLFDLYTVEINEDVRNKLLLLESEMARAEIRASDDMLRVLETLQTESERGRSNRALALDLLEKIASSQSSVQSPRYICSELNRFKRDIEEAEKEKERQDVQYMQQVMALLSQADAQMAFETSRKRYLELRREVSRSRENFTVHEPYARFKCHLTGKVMDDPVLISSGHTYEREAILREFEKGELKDPITGEDLQNFSLTPNHALYCTIKYWRQQNYVARILKAKIKLETRVEDEQEKALTDLSDLCNDSANKKDWMVIESLVPLILEALKPRNNELKALCFSVLKSIIEDSDYGKQKLAEAGGIKQIIRNLNRDPVVTREAVALLSDLVKNNNLVDQLGQERGAILTLATILVRDSHPELRTDIEGILDQLSYSENSYHEENIKAMVRANWCKPFVGCLCSGSEESKLAMANALAHFELDQSRREALIQQNVIGTLVGMLKSGQFRSECAALEALQNLSPHEKSKKHIAEAGGVPLLFDFLKKPVLVMKTNAAAILADLTMKHGAAFLLNEDGTPIESRKIVEAIMGILTVPSLPIGEKGVKILLGLAEPLDANEFREIIKDNDHHLQTFLGFIKLAQPPLRDHAIQLVFSLCRNDATAMSFIRDDQDCLKVLLRLIKNDSVVVSVHAATAGIFSCIPSSDSNLNRLMTTENVLPSLLKMVSSQHLELQANALGALIRFTDSSDIHSQRSLIEWGLMACLKQVLKSGTAAAKIWACVALGNISKSTPRVSREPHKWGFKLAKKSSLTCKLHKGRCSLKDCIVEAGVIPDIVETLKDQNTEVALAGLKALETLLLEESMLEHGVQILHDYKAIEQLFPVIHLDSHSCSEKCVELLEVILRFPGMKGSYGQMVQKSLTVLSASGVPSLQQKALRLFRQLTEFIS